jgi:uncharacterized protein YecT (DUF1311 family)
LAGLPAVRRKNFDARCRAFSGVKDGSIRQVQAAECICAMMEERARELEKTMEFD